MHIFLHIYFSWRLELRVCEIVVASRRCTLYIWNVRTNIAHIAPRHGEVTLSAPVKLAWLAGALLIVHVSTAGWVNSIVKNGRKRRRVVSDGEWPGGVHRTD